MGLPVEVVRARHDDAGAIVSCQHVVFCVQDMFVPGIDVLLPRQLFIRSVVPDGELTQWRDRTAGVETPRGILDPTPRGTVDEDIDVAAS